MRRHTFTISSHLRVALPLLLLLLAETATAFSLPTSSTNSDTIVTRSYSIHGNNINSNSCILHEVRPAPLHPKQGEEEDDAVELYYPTTRRSFILPGHIDGDKKPIDIRQTSSGCGALGATVWPSAIALAVLLAGDEGRLIEGKRVMELGSGCGLPSLVAKRACNARKVLATDYWEGGNDSNDVDGTSFDNTGGDRVMPNNLFGANLAHNIGLDADTTVRHLDWHDEAGIVATADEFRPEVIIGSDLVYYPMDTTPFLRTLEILMKGAGGADNALLILPLRPAYSERKALPEFRRRLEDGELGGVCDVIMDEFEMVGLGVHGDEDKHKFLRVRMNAKR